MVFATIFMVAFVLLGGVVLYLSRTIDHGEARFDASGKQVKDEQAPKGPATPASRLDTNNTGNDPDRAGDTDNE
ncbi:hypothetical protein FGU71_02105 [Erythrobacter insulae]|uniref:Uncharacterized protein n=1 Tax=Erythrobacter insulae TaxID=2584124 RepID=A0A547P9F0_9SPHN|nr:hypothetical protein [Erythrobacter insulae]TRD10778.1 hypothetical protein FGU71_02105 [Erythrobacter insulae]